MLCTSHVQEHPTCVVWHSFVQQFIYSRFIAVSLHKHEAQLLFSWYLKLKAGRWFFGASHLLWVPKLSSSHCTVTPIYEQLLDAVHISVVWAY